MKNTWRRQSASNSLENNLAYSQIQSSGSLPGVAERRHVAKTVETCEDYTAQKAEQKELHYCQSIETNFTPRDAEQNTGICGSRKDLTCGGNLWFAPDQPLRYPKTAVRRTSTRTSTKANLRGVAQLIDRQLDQLRCQGRLQWSIQKTVASKNKSARHTGRSTPVD